MADPVTALPGGYAPEDFVLPGGYTPEDFVTPTPPTPHPALTPPQSSRPDAGFLAGVKGELGDYKKVIEYVAEHPGEVPGALAEGLKGLYDYLANTSTAEKRKALSDFMHEVATHPHESLGRLAVDLPVGLFTGGVGGKLASTALKEGVTRALGTAAGGGLAASAGSGVRTRATTGRAVTPGMAGTAALVGAVGGGVAGGGVRELGKLARKGVERAELTFPKAVAALRDPVEYFEAKSLHDPDPNARRVYRYAHKALNKLSYYSDRAKAEATRLVQPLRELEDRLSPDEHDRVTAALQATDENWFDKKKRLDIPPEELKAKFGLSDKEVRAYKTALDTYYKAGMHYRDVWLREHPDAPKSEAPQVRYGMLPHRWDAPHRVYFQGDSGPEVRAFRSRVAATRFKNEVGGHYFDPEAAPFRLQDLDAAMQQVDLSKPEEALSKLARLAKPGSNLHGMFAQRKGVRGYTSLRSFSDLVDAIDGTAHAVMRAKYGMKMAPIVQKVKEGLQITGNPMESELFQSAYDRHLGLLRPGAIARGTKAVLTHVFLGIPNFIVSLLNLGQAAIGTPAFIMWESRKLARRIHQQLAEKDGLPAPPPHADEIGLARAIATTAQVLPAILPARVRKALFFLNNKRIADHIAQNEAAGIVPGAEQIQLGDVGAQRQAHVFRPGVHEKHPRIRVELNKRLEQAKRLNLWLLRHSEVAARRAVGAAMRDVGIAHGLTGEALDTFVHAATESAVGRFNKGMRAAVLEGGGSAAMDMLAIGLTFQTWIAQKSLQIARMAREHPKAAIALLGGYASLAGAEGVPIVVPVIDAAIDAVDPSGELRAEWEQFKLDHPGVFHGALSRTPVDMSGRFALGLPLNAASEYAFNPIGMYDTFARMLEATHDAVVGTYYSEGLGPAIAQGALQLGKSVGVSGDLARRIGAVRALMNGGEYEPVARGKYHPHEQISREEAIATALLGGVPRSVAEKQRKTSAEAELARSRRDRLSSIREAFIRDGDVRNAMLLLQATEPGLSARDALNTLKRWRRQAERRNRAWQPRLSKHDRRLR